MGPERILATLSPSSSSLMDSCARHPIYQLSDRVLHDARSGSCLRVPAMVEVVRTVQTRVQCTGFALVNH